MNGRQASARFGARLGAWLELMRISNLPTCASNAAAGVAIGLASRSDGDAVDQSALQMLGVGFIVVAMLYVGGMALNDVADLRIDRDERAQRPLPSGRITPVAALRFVIAMMVGGLALALLLGAVAWLMTLALVCVIVAYDLLHKRHPSSVVLMGMCRGLVYLIIACAVAWPPDWMVAGTLSAAITAYIIVLTFVARIESQPQRQASSTRGVLVLLLPMVVIAPLFVLQRGWGVASNPSLLIFVVWIAFSARHVMGKRIAIGLAVRDWLAAICLVDAVYCVALGQNDLASACLACFLVTVVGQRVVAAT